MKYRRIGGSTPVDPVVLAQCMESRSARLTLGFILIGLTLLFASPSVHATSTPWGDPVLGHSWDQLWVETLDQDFDSVSASILHPPSSTFEAPGAFSFSAAGWTVTSMVAREILAGGPDTSRLEFSTHFNGLPTDYSPDNLLGVDFKFYNDGQVVDEKYWIWDGAVWVDPDPPGSRVPDGGTTLTLLGLSVIALSAFAYRQRMSQMS